MPNTYRGQTVPLAPGDRVTGVFYGVRKAGTLTHYSRIPSNQEAGIVWVRWDGNGRDSWCFAESLTREAAHDPRD